MFDKFGEFDSAEELNRAAAAQLKEGDTQALYALAKENGIDAEDVKDYIDGLAPELCNMKMAAFGKLEIEQAELTMQDIMLDWITYIRVCINEDAQMAAAVRKKGKSLKKCIAAILAWSIKNAVDVSEDILKECNEKRKVQLGVPGMGTAKRLIREYYLGGKKK